MKPIDQQNYFELLDLHPSATAAEVESAYERAKAFYGPDSMATNSLVDAGEARSLLERIEAAHQTLSNPERRRSYEAALGLTAPGDENELSPAPEAAATPDAEPLLAPAGAPRVEGAMAPPSSLPPNESEASAALEPAAPAAGGGAPPSGKAEEPAAPSAPSLEPTFPWPGSRPGEEEHDLQAGGPTLESTAPPTALACAPPAALERAPVPEALGAPLESAPRALVAPAISTPKVDGGPPEEPRPVSPARPSAKPLDIGPSPVFSGELLRRVREGRGLSLRELSEKTRVGLSHLENVEADRYDALPVAVYLRGFLMLVARELKLDPLKVAKGYLELAAKAKASKS